MELSSEMIVDVILNIVNILVLFFIVRVLAYKPVKKFMEARTARVNALKLDAEKKASVAEAKTAECEAVIADSKKAMNDAVKEGEAAGRQEAQRIIEDANEKAKSIIQTAEKKASATHEKMLADAKDEVIALSLEISEKLLGREVTDEDNRKIVESFLGTENG